MKKGLIILTIMAAWLAMAGISSASETYTISVSQIVEHPALDAVRQGFFDVFEEKGVAVEKNVHIAQGNIATANQIASQILGEAPDLVLAIATPTAQACVQKIHDIPILATAVTDLKEAGLVESYEAPGANVTGMTDMSPIAEQVALIQEFLPEVKTIGVMYNAGEANSVVLVNVLKDVCAGLGINVEEATVANSSAVYQAAKSLVGKCDAVYVPTDNTVISALEPAVKVFVENQIPFFAADTDSVERGVVAALAVDYYRMGRQTAEMALRILQDGADTATMPVESLQDLRLYVNKNAAAAMGVEIPAAVLERADEVFE